MPKHVLKNSRTFLDKYDLTGDMSEVTIDAAVAMVNSTAFTENSETFRPGLKTADASGSGWWDSTPDTALNGQFALSQSEMTVIPRDNTEGYDAYFGKVDLATYQLGGSVGDMHGFSWAAKLSSGNLVRGKVSATRTATVSTGAATAQLLGAVSSTQKVYGCLHVTEFLGTGTLRPYIASDDAALFGSAATRLSFTAVTDETSEMLELAGPITDTYWRTQWTVSGSATVTFTTSVGIQS